MPGPGGGLVRGWVPGSGGGPDLGGSGPGEGGRGSAPRGGVETPPADYCCGWYASYWNAFLFFSISFQTIPVRSRR